MDERHVYYMVCEGRRRSFCAQWDHLDLVDVLLWTYRSRHKCVCDCEIASPGETTTATTGLVGRVFRPSRRLWGSG